MKYITLNRLTDFNKVIDAIPYFSGKIDEEIDHNMCAITINNSLAHQITVEDIKEYVNIFFTKKREQIDQCALRATCYIWLDEQAFQLRINILSGHMIKLPFGCNINIIKNVQPLLEKFLEISKIGVIPWEDITIVDNLLEDEDENDYILDVYLELI